MVKSVNTTDLKSVERKFLPVQVWLQAPLFVFPSYDTVIFTFVIAACLGVALEKTKGRRGDPVCFLYFSGWPRQRS